MSKVLIIGCGGVASVAIQKCCQNDAVFTEICIASRTVSKCDALKAKIEAEGKSKTVITTAALDADNKDAVLALIRSYQPDAVLNLALPYQDLTIMEACLEGVAYDKILKVGAVWTQISPMEFFMHNLVGANTLIMTVRTDTLADDAPLYDPKFFGVVRECVPSYIRLYVVEHSLAKPDRKCLASAKDLTDMYVSEDYSESVSYVPFKKRKNGGRTYDAASQKWVASCRNERNEEDEDY